jgi:hypothetical protein
MTQEAIAAQEATNENRQHKTTRKVARGATLENQAERYQAARRIIAEDGIVIQHMRLETVGPEGICGLHRGGMTIAYRQLETDSFVEIATAICSEKDVYDRKVGTILAVEQFDNLRRIRVPLFGAHPADAIEHLFRGYLTFIDDDEE